MDRGRELRRGLARLLHRWGWAVRVEDATAQGAALVSPEDSGRPQPAPGAPGPPPLRAAIPAPPEWLGRRQGGERRLWLSAPGLGGPRREPSPGPGAIQVNLGEAEPPSRPWVVVSVPLGDDGPTRR